tara:strand:- start:3108 stop:3758 length:651 start_codon:yes stop_codon:yes gene_type:complete
VTFQIKTFPGGPFDNLFYVVWDSLTREAAIVDPPKDIRELIQFMQSQSLTFSHIWLTHTHYDHIEGIENCLNYNPTLPIITHTSQAKKFLFHSNVIKVSTGDEIKLGSLSITIIHTPGHSPCGICFYSAPHCITGDTLFVDRCGRADIKGADVHKLYDSLQKLKNLPPETIIYPGHDYGKSQTDTIQNQCIQNPYLVAKNKETFIRYRMGKNYPLT